MCCTIHSEVVDVVARIPSIIKPGGEFFDVVVLTTLNSSYDLVDAYPMV